MTVARTTGHIPSVANGADAVSYEIVPSTLVVSLDKNDNWASGTTIYQSGNDKYAVVTLAAYKVTGDKRELFADCYWLGGSSNPISTSSYTRYMSKTDTSVDITLCKLVWTSSGTPTAGEVLARVTIAVNKAGKDGNRGSSGAVWRQHRGFVDSAYSYMAGGDDERFLDVVYANKHWYRCIKSYTSEGVSDERNLSGSSSFSKYWTTADMSGFTFIATDFLLAENAQINLFGSQEINLLKDTETGEIFGSYRVPSGNGDDGKYALWLGAATGEAAPFSVTSNGKTKIADADIAGKITATSGSIGGFSINSCSIGIEGIDSNPDSADGMLLTSQQIVFNKEGRQAIVGATSILGSDFLASFRDTKISLMSKLGVNLNVSGSLAKNVALNIGGGCVSGLAINTYTYFGGDVISDDFPTLANYITLDKSNTAVAISTTIRYKKRSDKDFSLRGRDVCVTLPEMSKQDDGHVVFIKRLPGNYDGKDIYLFPSTCWRLNNDGSETRSESIILEGRSVYTTSLKIDNDGDGMTLIFFYDIIVTVENKTYKGVWVQYKNPRDW